MNGKVPAYVCIAVSVMLGGCSTGAAKPEARPSIVPPIASVAPVLAPTVTATPATSGECYFMWAIHDLPELSDRLNAELKALGPDAGGSAYAYGEDCVQADGTRTFTAMETDFRVRVTVDNLSDKEHLGNWIADVMRVIQALPNSALEGPRPGRVEFEFDAANSDSRRLTVDIASYNAQTAGLQGARLFELLDAGP